MTSRTISAPAVEEFTAEEPAPRRSYAPLLARLLLLTLILVVAAAFRFNGLNWDEGRLLHPDERHIVDVITARIHGFQPDELDRLLDPAHSPINPRSVDDSPPPPGQQPRQRQFAYGSLPLLVTDFAAAVWGSLTGENWNGYFRIYRVGRVLTMLLDLATIALVYAIGRRAYGTVAGLLAAAFMALAVMPIQLAHFFVTDTWLTTFVTAALLAALVGVERARAWPFALAGFCVGCAMATKGTAALLAFPIAVALYLATTTPFAGWWAVARRLLALGAATLVAGLAGFLLFEPYALLDPGPYLRDLGEQSAIIGGKLDAPYTRQFIGTLPLLYQAKNLLGWGLGPLLGAAALLGTVTAGLRAWRQVSRPDIVLVSWVVPYTVLIASYEAKFTRYLLPLLPPLVLFAGALLNRLGAFGRVARRRPAHPAIRDVAFGDGRRPPRSHRALAVWAATALAVLILAGTLVQALAFSAIYERQHTRLAASAWIYANVPPGSKLTAESWDDPMPQVMRPGQTPGDYRYEIIWLELYGDTPACDRSGGRVPPPNACIPNTEATFGYLADQLARVDYVVESSPRLYGSIPRSPWRYPVQQHYFELLFAERLGFVKVYEGTSLPTLGPYTFDDRFMDESFTVYDHPPVTIFRKERQLSRDELRALFAPAIERPLSASRYPKAKTLLLDRLVDRLPAVGDYAWNRAIGSNGPAATLLWLVVVEALGLVALPLTLWLFRRFPDRGWGLARLLGWLSLGYVVWIGASLRLWQFTLPHLLVFAGLGALAAGTAAYRWRAWYRAALRGAGRAILLSEALFLGAGAFFLALRAINPDLWHTYWGGEKPMEAAHLGAILRSANFPPYDPWFADGAINYYYYGQYLVAVLIKLTGIPPEVAFNLAMPTVSALVAAAGYSVASALAARALPRERGRLAPAFGALGALLLTGIGNLDGFARLVGRARGTIPGELDFGYFWGASRAIEGAITEFPYFTQVWADLHAHAVALPITLLAVGTVVALAGTRDERSHAWGIFARLRRLAPYLALQALTLGALACTNSWDVPTYLLVTGAGLLLAGCLDRGLDATEIARRVIVAVAGTALVAAGAYALYLPFFRAFQALVGSLARTRVPTVLPYYLDHFGLFVAVTLATVGAGLAAGWRRGPRSRQTTILGALVLALAVGFVGLNSTRLTAALAGRGGPFRDWSANPGVNSWTAALLAALLVLLTSLWLLTWRQPGLQLPLVLLLGAVGVTLGPELVFVADDLQGGDWERMNTVFKFYLQGWTLYALGAAGALAWLFGAAPRWSLTPFRGLRDRADRRFGATLLRGGVALLLALLLGASLVYPVVATPIRLAERFEPPPGYGPTLDGLRWMEYGQIPNERCESFGFAGDYAAIRWFNETVGGTPVVAEASIGPYRGNGSRVSIATGLPTILGWERHEYQQRPALGIQARAADVRTLYNSRSEAEKLAILQRYHVSYVVVGAVERHWYLPPPEGAPACGATQRYASDEGLAALEGMAGRYLEPVFRSGETVVYRVTETANSSGIHAGPVGPGLAR